MNATPTANRLHIGFFGKRNSGKSSLVNAFVGQEVAVVSDVPGTTTDPVYKAVEIKPLGACTVIDTAGYDDDQGEIGKSRVEKTRLAAEKCDIAVIVTATDDIDGETELYNKFKEKNVPVLFIVNKTDEGDKSSIAQKLFEKTKQKAILTSTLTGEGIELIRPALARLMPEDFGAQSITGDLAKAGDVVMLIMPQDIQAPAGRLIMPQAQTIRELLDKKCIIVSSSADKMEEALAALSAPPALIITDSQVFDYVYARKPEASKLTSFSVLFAAYKGDINAYTQGAAAIDRLNGNSKVLIAECCAHAPTTDDIGRVKIPAMLRARYGQGLQVEVVSGTDFPEDLTGYDLIIQCGACMFNKRYVLSRIERAQNQGVPITNYGIAIAHIKGIPL
ncbi:MAG: [Clostridia bacterium]|nr:[FeFe] hydrogenase H-cluster maturation GTPase HydF [Clostridia bacterium]